MIQLTNIHKVYNSKKANEFEALKGISLTIEKGEMVAIIGKSGAGKSTLLHILACIDSYESGEYVIDIMDENSEKRCLYKALQALEEDELRLIYYIFYRDMTESECAKLYGNSKQAINKRKKRLLCKIAELLKNFEE